MIVMMNREGKELYCERVSYNSIVGVWICHNVYDTKAEIFEHEKWLLEENWDVAYEYDQSKDPIDDNSFL